MYKITKDLLTDNNAKTKKGEKKGYKTFIMYMAPFTQNSKGINVCSHASEGCAQACLFGSGFGGMYSNVEQGRINKTEWFLENRNEFLEYLVKNVAKLKRRYDKKDETLCIRLNGTSDLTFEKFKVVHEDKEYANIFEAFKDVQFYDYSKNYFRFAKQLPSNYHLTFSRSEENHDKAMEMLNQGNNVAIVFDELPETYNGYKVINGDENDLRFLDEDNVIVGLKYKKLTGKGADNKKPFESGFVIQTQK
jgi:hypothetical protein